MGKILIVFIGLLLVVSSGQPASAQGGVYIHGFCEADGEMVANVIVRIDRKIGWQWSTLPRSSTTNLSGNWGLMVPVEGVSWLRLRPAAPPEYELFGARFPGGHYARYIPGQGIELQAPSSQAGNFVFLFTRHEEPTPTTTPTATLQPTQSPGPTPFPGLEEWVDPPQTLENTVVQQSLELVSGWVVDRTALYQFAWDRGLGPWPSYGPVRFRFASPGGEEFWIEFLLFPGGNVVWHDVETPNRIRITNVSPYSW